MLSGSDVTHFRRPAGGAGGHSDSEVVGSFAKDIHAPPSHHSSPIGIAGRPRQSWIWSASSQLGRASAPIIPHLAQNILGPKDAPSSPSARKTFPAAERILPVGENLPFPSPSLISLLGDACWFYPPAVKSALAAVGRQTPKKAVARAECESLS